MGWSSSLKARVVLLVVSIMLPAFGALWYISDAHYEEARRGAQARLSQLALSVAGEERRLLAAIQRLLSALSESTALALDYQDACNFLVEGFSRHYAILGGIRVLEPGGAVWCGAELRFAPGILDRTITIAWRDDRYVAGPVELDAEGNPWMPVAFPFISRNIQSGVEARRLLVAAIDMRGFAEFSEQYHAEPGTVLALFDARGRMLVRQPPDDEVLGRDAQGPIGPDEIGRYRGTTRVFEVPGPDGGRLFAATALGPDEYPEVQLVIATGLPIAAVYADADRARWLGFGLVTLTALVIALVTILISRRFMRTDISPLLELTDRVAAGEVPDPLPPYSGPAEFAELREAIVSSARAQRESESALQFALRRLDTYFRNSPMAFIELDAEFRVRSWTPQAERVFGWTAAETVGKRPDEIGIVHPEDGARVMESLERAFSSGGYVIVHNRNVTRGGKTIWCEWHNSVLLGADGKMVSMLCIALDESERVVAALELERRERQYRLLFAENPSPMWVFDKSTQRFLAVNSAAVRAYGWSEEEFKRMSIRDIRPADELPRLQKELAATTRVDGPAGIWTHKTKSGAERLVEITSSDIVWEGHAARLVVAHDVTGRERAKADLEALTAELEKRVASRTNELEYVNRELEAFAYTVSHDLRGPLRSIDGFSHLLVEDLGQALPAEAAGYLERIGAASQRMGVLIDDLLALSRVNRGDIERRSVDLSALAAEVADEVRTGQPRDGVVEISIAPGMVVQADPGLLRVVLSNLIGNAYKFTAGREPGRIEIGVMQGDDGPVYHVRDNGVGFDMRYSDKLFGVFERLHGQDEFAGTGIGLATVQRIMHRHGGRVWAEGRPGEGATFWIWFPNDEGG